MRPLLALAGAVLLLAGTAPAASAMFPDPVPEPPALPFPPHDQGCVLPVSSLHPCAVPRRPQPLRSCVVPVFDPDDLVVPCPAPRRFDEGRIVPLSPATR